MTPQTTTSKIILVCIMFSFPHPLFYYDPSLIYSSFRMFGVIFSMPCGTRRNAIQLILISFHQYIKMRRAWNKFTGQWKLEFSSYWTCVTPQRATTSQTPKDQSTFSVKQYPQRLASLHWKNNPNVFVRIVKEIWQPPVLRHTWKNVWAWAEIQADWLAEGWC